MSFIYVNGDVDVKAFEPLRESDVVILFVFYEFCGLIFTQFYNEFVRVFKLCLGRVG